MVVIIAMRLNEVIIFEPWYWFVLGIALILLELFITTFALLWFGIAAVIVSLIYWLNSGLSTAMQIFIWAVLSLCCTFLWFKYAKYQSTLSNLDNETAKQALIGQFGTVIQNQVNHHTTIRFPMPILSQDEWHSYCGESLQIGDKVKVVATDAKQHILIIKKYQP